MALISNGLGSSESPTHPYTLTHAQWDLPLHASASITSWTVIFILFNIFSLYFPFNIFSSFYCRSSSCCYSNKPKILTLHIMPMVASDFPKREPLVHLLNDSYARHKLGSRDIDS